MDSVHKTVLLQETIEGLNLKGDGSNQIVVDATFGGGGHSELLCKKYPKMQVIALDQDKSAFKKASSKFENLNCNIKFVNSNFRNLDKALVAEGIEKVDGILFDLGLSSDQLENSLRGFSFMKDEKLLMTMKENPSREDLTAMDIVNTWGEENLATIIYGYGEEKFSRRIAKAIVDARQKKKLETTFDLVQIIESAVPGGYKKGRLHFATKTFQALRIAVNDELGALQDGLVKALGILNETGRMSVISFHSLEDRIAKRFFRDQAKESKLILINKKPIVASKEEIKNNPRARSAKLRVIEKK